MELTSILKVLLRRWWLVLIPVIAVAAVTMPGLLSNRNAVSGGFSTMLRYSAAQVLEAIPNRDGDYQDVWLASELAVNALADWIRTGSFVSEIMADAARNGVEVNAGALGIAADNRRSVGQLFLSYPDADGLAVITESAVRVLQTRAQDYFPQLGGQPALVTILDQPVIVPSAPPIANRLEPLIRLGLGLLVGIGLAFLAEYLDPTLRRREQVEQLGLPVIAALPKK